MGNGAMDADLRDVSAAVVPLSDDQLERLVAATYGVPEIAQGLLT